MLISYRPLCNTFVCSWGKLNSNDSGNRENPTDITCLLDDINLGQIIDITYLYSVNI